MPALRMPRRARGRRPPPPLTLPIAAMGPEGHRARPNPFAPREVGALSDDELRDRIGIYRTLLARLPDTGRMVAAAREDVAGALRELEGEAARRGLVT
jgi:hypothetical protein